MSKRPMPPSFSEEQEKGIHSLPEELLECVCEFAVRELRDVGPLALASKQLRASVTSATVMGGLTMRTADRFSGVEKSMGTEASLLEVYLKQAAKVTFSMTRFLNISVPFLFSTTQV